MKLKRKIGIGLAVTAATYCVLAYIFMWPPVVTNYHLWHRAESSGNACINNLRQMDAAMNQFALEHNKQTGDLVSISDLTPYIQLNMHGQIPPCPAGGTYTIRAIGIKPTCSITNPVTNVRVNCFFYAYTSGPHQLP